MFSFKIFFAVTGWFGIYAQIKTLDKEYSFKWITLLLQRKKSWSIDYKVIELWIISPVNILLSFQLVTQ